MTQNFFFHDFFPMKKFQKKFFSKKKSLKTTRKTFSNFLKSQNNFLQKKFIFHHFLHNETENFLFIINKSCLDVCKRKDIYYSSCFYDKYTQNSIFHYVDTVKSFKKNFPDKESKEDVLNHWVAIQKSPLEFAKFSSESFSFYSSN